MMSFSIKVSHESDGITSWKENNIIKPGKKWYVPLDAVNEMENKCFKISPMNEQSDDIYQEQPLYWNSSLSNELISFKNEKNEKIFIQVK
jgi:hypothetical protein